MTFSNMNITTFFTTFSKNNAYIHCIFIINILLIISALAGVRAVYGNKDGAFSCTRGGLDIHTLFAADPTNFELRLVRSGYSGKGGCCGNWLNYTGLLGASFNTGFAVSQYQFFWISVLREVLVRRQMVQLQKNPHMYDKKRPPFLNFTRAFQPSKSFTWHSNQTRRFLWSAFLF